jgi:2-amino-4-hydroxy-6-hydroxymethyldihydropteridine diphosphokinase
MQNSVKEHDVFIGLGSNLNDPVGHLRRAVAEIARLDRVELTGLSSVYRSAPLGHADQPDFFNAVLRVRTCLAPAALLAALHDIEQLHGRSRLFRNAPRTLDLDVLIYGALRQDDPTLTLPHPRCHERAFVLSPLVEIAPDCVIPGRGPAADCFAACADQAIEQLGALDHTCPSPACGRRGGGFAEHAPRPPSDGAPARLPGEQWVPASAEARR